MQITIMLSIVAPKMFPFVSICPSLFQKFEFVPSLQEELEPPKGYSRYLNLKVNLNGDLL